MKVIVEDFSLKLKIMWYPVGVFKQFEPFYGWKQANWYSDWTFEPVDKSLNSNLNFGIFGIWIMADNQQLNFIRNLKCFNSLLLKQKK